jgi:hypothetical protein
MTAFFFSGLNEDHLFIEASHLQAAVARIEQDLGGTRLIQIAPSASNPEIVAISLGDPDANGFQSSRFEGAFILVSQVH